MSDLGLQKVFDRLAATLARDNLVQQTTNYLRDVLQVDRVVLYYFYREWEGRVTFESLSESKFSVFGKPDPMNVLMENMPPCTKLDESERSQILKQKQSKSATEIS